MNAAALTMPRTAAPAVVHSPVVTEHQTGRDARRRILAELLRRETACEPAPTTQDLGDMLGSSDVSALYHCRRLRDASLITWVPRRARTMRLTAKGRASLK